MFVAHPAVLGYLIGNELNTMYPNEMVRVCLLFIAFFLGAISAVRIYSLGRIDRRTGLPLCVAERHGAPARQDRARSLSPPDHCSIRQRWLGRYGRALWTDRVVRLLVDSSLPAQLDRGLYVVSRTWKLSPQDYPYLSLSLALSYRHFPSVLRPPCELPMPPDRCFPSCSPSLVSITCKTTKSIACWACGPTLFPSREYSVWVAVSWRYI